MRPLVISALVRGDRPDEAAAAASRRLVQLVAEWPQGTSLDVVTAAVRRGRVGIRLQARGPLPEETEADVRWALGPVALLGTTRGAPLEVPRRIFEVRASRDVRLAPRPSLERDNLDREPSWITEAREYSPRQETPWPTAVYSDSAQLITYLAEQPGLSLMMRLAPCSEVEVEMVEDALRRSWTGAEAELHHYLGHPVRIRTLVGADGQLPPRLRVIVRRWGAGLEIVEPVERVGQRAWADPVVLAGHAAPEAMAVGMLRLPAAGIRPIVGISSVPASSRSIVLDPVPPRPTVPVRIGTAKSVTGRRVDVSLEIDDLLRHVSIEGASGAGKSTLIAAISHSVINRGYGLTYLDPHGTGVDCVIADAPALAARSITVVRHGHALHPTGVNLLSGTSDDRERAIDTFIELVQRIYDPRGEGMVGARWKRWFGLLAEGTVALMGARASLPAVVAVASDQRRIRRLSESIAGSHPELAHRIRNEVGNLEGKESSEMIAWAVSKLHPLVSTQRMRDILGTGVNAVDVGAVMRDGTALLVDLASADLGTPGSRMLGALWLMQHWLEMGRRGARPRPHVIVVDEAHLVQHGALPNLLSEGRKYGIGVVVASQYFGQLSDDLAESLDANAGSVVSLRTGVRHAPRASVRLGGWPVGDLSRLPDLRAAAVLSRSGVQTEPFSLEIDHHSRMRRSGADQGRGARVAAVDDRSRRQLWQPYSTLRAVTDREVDEYLAGTRVRSLPRLVESESAMSLEEWFDTRRLSDTEDSHR